MSVTASTNGTYAFLYDADYPELGGYYGYPCKKALFYTLLNNNKTTSVFSRIYSGDMLVYNVCEKIVEVKSNNYPYGMSTTYQVDKDFYMTIITDLVSSIKERYNTVLAPDLPMLLARHNIYCIVLTGLSNQIRDLIENHIKKDKWYIGAFELDMGNPLHIMLFIESLIYDSFLKSNELFCKREFFAEEDYIPDWAMDNPGVTVKFLDYDDFISNEPVLNIPEEISIRGKKSLEIIEQKGSPDHYQKIARELSIKSVSSDFNFVINESFTFRRVSIPKEKLTQYCLNSDHPQGKHKAKLFKELLNITKDDWRFLAAQINNGLENGTLYDVRVTEYGIKYYIDIPIKGLNGISKNVRTAWIIKDGITISLTTAYIVDQTHQDGSKGTDPSVVQENDKNLFWKTLYSFAHSEGIKASSIIIPTPMYITGYTEPVMDGPCGFAWVIIKDARKGFAKWLKQNNIGHLYHRGGWSIFVATHDQSYERAKAYAEAFEKVLLQNGIDCYSESKYD